MERIKNKLFILPLFFFFFCSSQQDGNINEVVKEGLKNINQANNIFFKELKTNKFLLHTDSIGIYRIIRTNKKYKHPYIIFYNNNDYSLQDAENVKDSILKIIEFTDNNNNGNDLKEYITAYMSFINETKEY